MATKVSSRNIPEWMCQILKLPQGAAEGSNLSHNGRTYSVQGGILRDTGGFQKGSGSASQQQTSETFGFKWQRRDTFENPAALGRVQDWLRER